MNRVSACVCVAFVVGCEQPLVNVVTEGRCAPVAGEPARPAADFLDTLGINTSLADAEDVGPNGKPYTATLSELGIRHIQSGELSFADHGPGVVRVIKSGFVPLWRLNRNSDVAAFLGSWAGFVPAVTLPDPDDFNSNSNFKALEALQRAKVVRAVVDALPVAQRPQIIGFRLSSLQDVEAVGDLSELVDAGGFRSSIPPQAPEESFGAWFTMARSLASRRPLLATQVGYEGGPAGAGNPREGEAVQAKYVMRILFESFNQGVVRSYYDGLFDACGDCNGGLARIDGTPKPAFTAWQTMVKILRDEAPVTPAAPQLPFTFESGGNEQSKLHHTLLVRADGTFVLFLWLQGRSNDVDMTGLVKLRVGWPLRSATLRSLLSPATSASLDPTMPLSIPVTDMPVAVLLQTACSP